MQQPHCTLMLPTARHYHPDGAGTALPVCKELRVRAHSPTRLVCCSQAQALQLQTLKDLEPIVSQADGGNGRSGGGSKSSGGGGGSDGGDIGERCQAAVRRHLHEGAYQQQEIEGLLGTSLQEFFGSSPSSLRHAQKLQSYLCIRDGGGFRSVLQDSAAVPVLLGKPFAMKLSSTGHLLAMRHVQTPKANCSK